VVEVAPQPVLEPAPRPAAEIGEPIVAHEPEPDGLAKPEPEPEPEPEAELEPPIEISYPDAEQAPPGLSVDAFKDIKPVSFGGIVEEDDAGAPSEPAPVEPEPVIEPEPAPVTEPEPVLESDPVVEPEPVPILEPEPIPVAEPEPVPRFEPLSYPLDDEPVITPVIEPEEELTTAAAVTESVTEQEPKPKRRGFRIPGGVKLPSTGIKLPRITLPPNLDGPLSDLERKIALGSVVAIIAAGALGYATAPSDEAVAPSPAPAPAAASR
jgi:hypothetical protein